MAASIKFLSFETVSLVVAFAILASAGVVTFHTENYRRESGALVRHTLEVESALYRLDSAIRRAESDERGYLISGDPAYLTGDERLSERLEAELTKLDALVSDNPTQTQRIEALRPLIKERADILAHQITLMKAGQPDQAAQLVRNRQGKELMEQIDALIRDMISHEEDLYRERDRQLSAATDSLQVSIAAMIAILAGVAVFSVFLTYRQIVALRKSGESLRRAYDELIHESTRRGALEAQLRQSQKLEALGQLAGGIAHDFNNMLGVIVASLNLMRRKLRKDELGLEPLIGSAMGGAERAAALVRRLLAFSRIQPLRPEPVDANELVNGMLAILQRTLGSKIAIETVFGKHLWPIKVDANELESAIVNLSVNARDAMPTGGTLRIHTANVVLDESFVEKNPEARPGEYVLLSVADTGEGMTPDVAAKAFEPFFTTKPEGKGTGLGLSQAHGFVRQSGGYIQICSQIGRGTSVKLYLPRYRQGEAVAPPPQELEPAEDFPHGRRDEIILLVMGDEPSRRVTSQGVRELGYTVIEAKSAREAIEVLRGRSDMSLMITDLCSPEIDGAHLAREAVFRRHSLHVLFVSDQPPHTVMSSSMLDAESNLLTKPFTLAQLARKIRDALDGRVELLKGRIDAIDSQKPGNPRGAGR